MKKINLNKIREGRKTEIEIEGKTIGLTISDNLVCYKEGETWYEVGTIEKLQEVDLVCDVYDMKVVFGLDGEDLIIELDDPVSEEAEVEEEVEELVPAGKVSNNNIEIAKIRMSSRKNIAAYADVTINGTKVYDFRIVRSKRKEGEFFLATPTYYNPVTKKFYPSIKFNKELYLELQDRVLKAFNEIVKKNNVEEETKTEVKKETKTEVKKIEKSSEFEIAQLGTKIEKDLHDPKVTEIMGRKVEISKNAKVRMLNINGTLFIQQNPNTKSKYAELARKGHKVTWISKENKYIGVIVDGKYEGR